MPGATSEEKEATACHFCNRAEFDEKWGDKITKDGITVHYFCMLFSSGLIQNGEDDVGIMGFMPKDISKEITRSRRLKCVICKKKGASVGCAISSCRMSFHYPCGLTNKVLYQYFGRFHAFCLDHRPEQAKDLLWSGHPCTICKDEGEEEMLLCPSCSHGFHRGCVQGMATACGMHFFRCPLCNNTDRFLKEMQIYGIHVPDRDAAWELEPNAFQELVRRHNYCDVVHCQAIQGRDYSERSGEWKIKLCKLCGSHGCHLVCGNLSSADDWICPVCQCCMPSVSPAAKEKTMEDEAMEDDIIFVGSLQRRLLYHRLPRARAVNSLIHYPRAVRVTPQGLVTRNQLAPHARSLSSYR